MAHAGSIEVPVEARITIPFHEGELIRIEMERVTLIDKKPVRARYCDILVDGQRLHGVQALVVLDQSDTSRIAGAVFKALESKADEDVARLTTEPETTRHDIEVQLRDPDDGQVLRAYKITDARVLAHTLIDAPKWAWLDFIGTAAE